MLQHSVRTQVRARRQMVEVGVSQVQRSACGVEGQAIRV